MRNWEEKMYGTLTIFPLEALSLLAVPGVIIGELAGRFMTKRKRFRSKIPGRRKLARMGSRILAPAAKPLTLRVVLPVLEEGGKVENEEEEEEEGRRV